MALGGMIWVLVVMLFGNIKNEMFESINAEAQVQLSHICDLEQAYFESNKTYTQDLERIGFYQSDDDGSQFIYEIGLADSSRFIARAFARKDYDLDKQQLTWQIKNDCVLQMIEED